MILYVDSSVILRWLLGQADPLVVDFRTVQGVTSALTEVECLRTLDRLSKRTRLDEKILASKRALVYQLMKTVEVVEPTPAILDRASLPFPTTLATLDAIHLASALVWQERTNTELILATHDAELALAGQATNFQVLGVKA